jgi:hypothetical protein
MEGQLPPDTVLTGLLPETKAIIHTLASVPERIHPEAGVMEHSFHSLYKSLNEKTLLAIRASSRPLQGHSSR